MTRLLIYFFKFYKRYISDVFVKFFGNACRFTPSCSEYTIEALEKYGIRGMAMGFGRVLRCHPLGGSGWDPVK